MMMTLKKFGAGLAAAALAFVGLSGLADEVPPPPTQTADWFTAGFDGDDTRWEIPTDAAEFESNKLVIDTLDNEQVVYTPATIGKSSDKVTVRTTVETSPASELPAVPTAQAAFVVLQETDGLSCYGLAKVNDAAAWVKLTGATLGETMTLTAEFDYSAKTVTYKVGDTALSDGSNTALPLADATQTTVSSIAYAGSGVASLLDGDYRDADRQFAVVNAQGGYDYFVTEAEAQTAAGRGGEYLAFNSTGGWESKTAPAKSDNFFEDETTANLWHVANATGLAEFREAVNAGDTFAGKTVVLDANIDLSSVASWTPIGTNDHPFSGVFNGQNHTISNLKHTGAETASQVGLFGLVSGVKNADYTGVSSVWENETFFETNIAESKYTAVVKNIVLADVAIENTDSTYRYTGALVGEALNAYIANVSVTGAVTGPKGVGGVVGSLDGSVAKNCANSATVTATGYNVGGIAGGANYCNSDTAACCAFIGCSNDGKVTTTSDGGHVGGIVGMPQSGTCVVVTGCSNSGEIHSVGASSTIGGISGQGIALKVIVDCTNTGTLTSETKVVNAGGIAGYATAKVYNCDNMADITISADALAGVYNFNPGQGGDGACVNCSNVGTLTNTNLGGKTYPIGGGVTAAVYSDRTFADVAALNAFIAANAGDATEFQLKNCTVTDPSGTLALPSSIQSVIFDQPLCAAVDASTGSSKSLAVNIPGVAVSATASKETLFVKGANSIVTVANGATIGFVSVSGNGSKVVNNGTIDSLNLDAAGTVEVENNGTLGKLNFNNTGTYNVVNKGAISHQTADTNIHANEHTVDTIVACTATIDNYGTIEAKANANGVCSYALLFYNGANVVINSYKDSVLSADKNGCFIACGSAEAVTLNVEEGAVFKYGETPFTPVSSGKLTVQAMVKPVASVYTLEEFAGVMPLTVPLKKAVSGAFLDMDFWGLVGCLDADGNECPQYVEITDKTLYRDTYYTDESDPEAWVSANYLFENYLAAGKRYDDYQTDYMYSDVSAGEKDYSSLEAAMSSILRPGSSIKLKSNTDENAELSYCIPFDRGSFTCGELVTPNGFAVYTCEKGVVVALHDAESWEYPGHYDVSWYTENQDASEYEISTAAQLAGLAVLANGSLFNANGEAVFPGGLDFAGKTITLTDDIDLSDYRWIPISGSAVMFAGTFNGNGKRICGMTVDGALDSVKGGLFNSIGSGRVCDIWFCDCHVSGSYVGMLADTTATGSVLEGVVVKADCSATATSYASGIVSTMACGDIYNCWNYATVTSDFIASGIVGYIQGSDSDRGQMTNCVNKGAITGANRAGGIAAHANYADVSWCYNTGTVSHTAEPSTMPVGGIVAAASYESTITYCLNTGAVSACGTDANATAGGILGQATNPVTTRFCDNCGDITANGQCASGIAASLYSTTTEYCRNGGTVTSVGSNAGGIAADPLSSNSSTKNCVCDGALSGLNTWPFSKGNTGGYYYEGDQLKTASGAEATADEAVQKLNDAAAAEIDFWIVGDDGRVHTILTVPPDPQEPAAYVAEVISADGTTTNKFETLQAAIAAVTEDGATVKLLTDVELDAVLNGGAHSITIDGDGHTFTQKEGVSPYHWFNFGEQQDPSGVGKSFTFKNATIDGFTSGTYMFRVEECAMTIDNVTFNECAGTYITVFTYADATIRNCEFTGNTASKIIDFNSNATVDNDVGILTIANTLFDGNEVSDTGLIYIAKESNGTGSTITDCSFVENTCVAEGAASMVYLSQKADIANTLFEDNIVTSTSGTDGKVGVICLGSGAASADITENAFERNVVTAQEGQATGTVFAGANDVDLSANYWDDGTAPETGDGKDIYTTKTGIIADTYATDYTVNEDGYGVTVTVVEPVAEMFDAGGQSIGTYLTLQLAVDAYEALEDKAGVSIVVRDTTASVPAGWKIVQGDEIATLEVIPFETENDSGEKVYFETLQAAYNASKENGTIRIRGTGTYEMHVETVANGKKTALLDIGSATLNYDAYNLGGTSSDLVPPWDVATVNIGHNGKLAIVTGYGQSASTYCNSAFTSADETAVLQYTTYGNRLYGDNSGFKGTMIVDASVPVSICSDKSLVKTIEVNGSLAIDCDLTMAADSVVTGSGNITVNREKDATLNGDFTDYAGTFGGHCSQGDGIMRFAAATFPETGIAITGERAGWPDGNVTGRFEIDPTYAGIINASQGRIFLNGNTTAKLGGVTTDYQEYVFGSYGAETAGDLSVALTTENVIGTVGETANGIWDFSVVGQGQQLTGNAVATLTDVNFTGDGYHGVFGAVSGATVSGGVNVTMNRGAGKQVIGALNADVTGETKITVNGATLEYLCGIENPVAAGSGDITLVINDGTVNSAYGAWLHTGYDHGTIGSVGDVTVSVLGGTVTGGVRGGNRSADTGSEDRANFRADSVTINLGGGEGTAKVIGAVYGSSMLGVDGDITVNVKDGAVVTKDIYAGSKYASTIGKTAVNVRGGSVSGNIYGGSGGGSDSYGYGSSAAAEVNVSGGTVTGTIYANGSSGDTISGNATVSVSGGEVNDLAVAAGTVNGQTIASVTGGAVNGNITGFDSVSLDAPLTMGAGKVVSCGAFSNAKAVTMTPQGGVAAIAFTTTFANTGSLTFDLTGATAESIVLVDNAGSAAMTLADYGTVTLTGSDAYIPAVVNGDLCAVKPAAEVAQIGELKYETLGAAFTAAKTGDKVVLIGAATGEAAVPAGKALTLDATDAGSFAGSIAVADTASLAIRGGKYNLSDLTGAVTLYGGIYAAAPDAAFVATGYEVANNPDEETVATYPKKVQEKTVKTEDDEPIVIDIDPTAHEGLGESVPVVVTQELAKEILGEDVTTLTTEQKAQVVETLETKGEDGMTGWQKYTAGFKQTDKHPLAPKGKGGENGQLVLVTSLITPKQLSVDTGVMVKYILMQGSNVSPTTGLPTAWTKVQELPTPEFPVDVTQLDPETYWKIDVEYTATRVVETEVNPEEGK